jgi:hypothetical protein
MTATAVCGACLRVGVFASYREAEEADCACGEKFDGNDGPYCPCRACEEMARQLQAGGRCAAQVSMLLPDVVLKSWTAEGGAVFA